jgi:hypothetical protein
MNPELAWIRPLGRIAGYRIRGEQSGGNETILQPVSCWHGGANAPNGARARKITAEVPTEGDTQWFSIETGEPDRLYLLPQDPIAALVGSKYQLLELRRQPQAALPARANWTNIFGYRLDLMSKSCLNPPYVVGVSCFCRR